MPDLSPEAVLAYDREHLWHPYTSMTEPTPVRLVESASGVRLRLVDGTELVVTAGISLVLGEGLVTPVAFPGLYMHSVPVS